ncbi:hypothetical protein E2P81_ATG09475 [Venturia nashicola]|uniref:Uncharacterized protein n=1 Tax=Venturia nashicola TaxID=86259 RepID=A0A4Z1P521_9PEZI|nr:hypothetical protein E6O75_ATG09682 [Venturia nashicola]TLD25818.1 hypothetical protein E2P81_ATG09475 [Venturia nashicola]
MGGDVENDAVKIDGRATFQPSSLAQPDHPHRCMSFPRILLDDNFALGKRRRDDVDDGAAAVSRSLSRIGKASMTIKTDGLANDPFRTSLPSPPLDHEDHELFTSASCQRHDTPPPAKTRRKAIPMKRIDSLSSLPIPTITHQPGQLAACCCCSSKPMRKTDLERYSDCQMCEKRACTVCIRTCHGSCGDRKICKQCSVEQGEERDSFCLDCMNKEEDHEMED